MEKFVSDAFDKLDSNKDGKITSGDVEALLAKIEPKVKELFKGQQELVQKAFDSFRAAIDRVKASDGTIKKEDVEKQFRELVSKLQSHDLVKAAAPFVSKAVFGLAVGVAAHKVSDDKIVGFGVGLLHVTSTVLFEKGVFSAQSVESLRAMSKEDVIKLLDQDNNNKITPNDFAILFEKQFKALKETRPGTQIMASTAVAAASFAVGFVFLSKYFK